MCALLILYFAYFLVFCIYHKAAIRHRPFQVTDTEGKSLFSFLYFFIVHFSENTSPPFPMDLVPWLVGWRAVWALLSTSYYVPDETWQSVEVNTFFMYCFVGIFAF